MEQAGPAALAIDALVHENQRLIRRLARERATRLEVEAIAEKGLRDLYDKQRQLAFLEQTATLANRGGSMLAVLEGALAQICQFTGWHVAHAYALHGQGDARRMWPTKIWHVDDGLDIGAFRLGTEQCQLGFDQGLPGRVWATAAPVWLADIAAEERFLRRGEALQCGLRAAFATPLLVESEVAAVLEVFTDRVMPEDPALLQIMAQAGTQLGRVIERDRASDRLHDALHDPLTALANRPAFLHRLEHALAECRLGRSEPFAVLFLDLDRFGIVNDSLGPACGDALIAQMATRLKRLTWRAEPVLLARLGGDEFTMLLPGLRTPEEASAFADRVHAALRESFCFTGHEVVATASIGVAFATTETGAALELLRDADLAMHHAKSRGRAGTELYDTAMHASALRRIGLESELRMALRDDAFVLHYQPIVSLATEEVCGFEALVRWQTAPGVLRLPGDFIPVAEETGLIVPLGMLVLLRACRQLRDWSQRFPVDPPRTMSVNLSPRQFLQTDLVEQVASAIAETGIEPATLRLEITESVTMDNAERSVQVLTALRALGVGISIDDFGTGYSCLSYLHRFPLQVLKIDRSFVSRIEANVESRKIVQTIVGLARSLDMQVIAEGAETAAEVTRLRALGCDYCQGFFYHRPLPASAAEQLLRLARLGPDHGAAA